MTPGAVLVWAVIAVACGLGGYAIGKSKGRPSTGAWLGVLLGIIGIVIIACMPRDKEGQIREEQRKFEIQAEAARRAGYQFPPPGPDGPPQWPGPQ